MIYDSYDITKYCATLYASAASLVMVRGASFSPTCQVLATQCQQ